MGGAEYYIKNNKIIANGKLELNTYPSIQA